MRWVFWAESKPDATIARQPELQEPTLVGHVGCVSSRVPKTPSRSTQPPTFPLTLLEAFGRVASATLTCWPETMDNVMNQSFGKSKPSDWLKSSASNDCSRSMGAIGARSNVTNSPFDRLFFRYSSWTETG
jgi:hypothetical protein